MLSWWFLIFTVWWLQLGSIPVVSTGKLNIALHAQVLPNDNEKIVGSVITTDGLRRAFARRPYVNNVTVFYPSAYDGFFDLPWDYIIIEGWFPSIRDFIATARNHAPAVRVVFFCLDPSYPGLDQLLSLDFDGIMTNSELVLEILRHEQIPGSLQLLAADTDVMRPRPDVARTVATAYVGAGGHMLVVKPGLKTMLQAAKDVGLHLYGTGWGAIPEFREVWRGTLPRYELAQAYARADIVLASTIKSQDDFGMINNRIFEALSCGALVLSEYSSTLAHSFGDVLSFFNESQPVAAQLQRLLTLSPQEAAIRRQRARQRIEQEHTWMHRVVSIENFLFHLPPSTAPRPSRRHPLRALLVASPRLVAHIDYQHIVEAVLVPYMETQGMHVTRVADDHWPSHAAVVAVDTFHIVVAVCSAFDDVDRWMQSLPFPLHVQSPSSSVRAPAQRMTWMGQAAGDRGQNDSAAFAVVQKRAMVLLGIDVDGARHCRAEYLNSTSTHRPPPTREQPLPPCADFTRYDTVFHRSSFEVDRIRALFTHRDGSDTTTHTATTPNAIDPSDADDDVGHRCIPRDRTQHLMGLRNETTTFLHATATKHVAMFVCFWAHRDLCRRSSIDRDFAVYTQRLREVHQTGALQPMVVLVGGPSLAAFVAGLPTDDDRLVETTGGEAAVARLVHWADGVQRPDVLELLLHATAVVQFYLPDTRGVSWPPPPSSDPRHEEDTTDHHYDVTTDVTVLLTAAALGEVRVHLEGYHEHFLRIAQAERPAVWTGQHLDLMLRNGFHRLLSVASTRARVQAQFVGVHWDATSQRWQFDDPQHPLATTAFEVDFLTTTLTLHYQRPFLVLQLDTVDAMIGRDTLLCLNNDELRPPRRSTDGPTEATTTTTTTTEAAGATAAAGAAMATSDASIMCLLRPMALVVVVFDDLPSTSTSTSTSDEDRLWVAMRGSMFGNFHQMQSLPLRFATLDIVGAPPKPALVETPTATPTATPSSSSSSSSSWQWSLPSPRDDVFVYVYRRPGSY